VGVHALGEYTRMRVCCAWLAYGCLNVLDITCAFSLTHRLVYVLRGVHPHARVLRVLALGCPHALSVTCACFLDARVGLCA
jgi:hypothetical protein